MAFHSNLAELPVPPDGNTGWPWTEQSPHLAERMPNGQEWPRISIVTPSFNQGQFLEETIRSVLLQGYPNLEYIIIDGGSTDNSVEIIKKYEPWLAYWVSEKDRGQAHAINKGMEMVKGDIAAYINSDDFYMPSAFQEAAVTLANQEADLYYGRMIEIPSGKFWRPAASGRLAEWIRGVGTTIPQPSSFWRTSPSLPEFDEKLNCVFDREFFMQLIRQKKKVVSSDKAIATFRIHGASKTSQLEDQFFRENMTVNYRMLQFLAPKEQAEIKKHLHYEKCRRRFHQTKGLSMKTIAQAILLVALSPSLLLKRELYGRIKIMASQSLSKN